MLWGAKVTEGDLVKKVTGGDLVVGGKGHRWTALWWGQRSQLGDLVAGSKGHGWVTWW